MFTNSMAGITTDLEGCHFFSEPQFMGKKIPGHQPNNVHKEV